MYTKIHKPTYIGPIIFTIFACQTATYEFFCDVCDTNLQGSDQPNLGSNREHEKKIQEQ
jgi:hypothetical protein